MSNFKVLIGLCLLCTLAWGQSAVDLARQGRAKACDKDYAQALSLFEQALAKDSACVEAVLGKIDASGYQRKLDQAKQWVAGFPADSALRTLAEAHIKIWERNLDGAMTQLETLRDDPVVGFAAMYLMGHIKFMKREWDQSITLLQSAQKKSPENTDILFLLGDVYRVKNDASQVTEFWSRYLELSPKGNACHDYVNDYLLSMGGR